MGHGGGLRHAWKGARQDRDVLVRDQASWNLGFRLGGGRSRALLSGLPELALQAEPYSAQARCIRDGKKESDRMPLRESVLMMRVSSSPCHGDCNADNARQTFDEIRRQGGLVYPEEIETLEKRDL